MKEQYPCYDCAKAVTIDGDKVVGGVELVFEDRIRFKCTECFKKNPDWEDSTPCEVYSRIVGYLRPVSQWNTGKQKEFDQRKTFKLKKHENK